MSVELTPLGVACNLSCTYCYQMPMREAGNVGNTTPYDMEKMLAALEAAGAPFTVFGGEPLMVPIADLERIFAWGFAKYGQNGIQTNGVLITPAHVALFAKYRVHVGFSLDGPGELNDTRWAGTLERTRADTAQSHAHLKECVAAGVGVSVIITLTRGNASADRWPRFVQWLRELDTMGIRAARIHLLEVEHAAVAAKLQLPQAEVITRFQELAALEGTLHGLRFDIFTEMRDLLRGEDERVTCIWNPCDPYTTSAVQGIDGQGEGSNCGRTNKDGIPRLKAETPGFERQLALYHTPQEAGGCAGCRFFLMCKGQCPGTAIGGDWRNRTADCEVWKAGFTYLEQELVAAGERPLSLNAEERGPLEAAMLTLWAQGQHAPLKHVRARLRAGETAAGVAAGAGGDRAHGDTPHGDTHGDHTDRAGGV
jgi:uncharacterized protein